METMKEIQQVITNLFNNVTIEFTEEGEMIVTLKESVADEFKQFVREIPDFIYEDVLEEFSKRDSLKRASDLLTNGTEEEIKQVFNIFQEATHVVATRTIDKLKKY